MVRFAQLNYLPTLLLRQQELRGVSKLTSAEKDLLFPLFRIRPWAGKQPLTRSIEKIAESLGDRPFACDLDDYYEPENVERLAVQEFLAIKADDTTEAWFAFVQPFEKAIPTIRLTPTVDQILAIINRPWIAERGFGIVLSTKNEVHHHKLEQVLRSIPHNNFFVVVDAGWSKDPLLQAAWATRLSLRVFEVGPGISLFVSSSSFPAAFGDMGLDGTPGQVRMTEYALHGEVARQVAQRFNQSKVGYADWATTRPPSSGGGGAPWVPRIDIPQSELIRVYRERIGENEDKTVVCTRLAQKATRVQEWPSPPPSWGHYSVDLTASGAESGIYSAAMNTATRINMHLHRALSAPTLPPPSLEEKFVG